MKSIKYLAATGLIAASMQVDAGLLDSVDGTSSSVSGKANFFEFDIGSANYDLGANLEFGSDAYPNVNLTFTFLGNEGSWETIFSAYGAGSLSSHGTDGTFFTVSNVDTTLNDGLLEFEFNTVTGTTGAIANGDNSWTPEFDGKSFAVIIDTTFKGVAYDALLLWDDAGGGGDDDNHDDQVIGLNISKVPEPGTIALLGLGLLGLGMSRRRSK
jgi:PEP-CTERM motif